MAGTGSHSPWHSRSLGHGTGEYRSGKKYLRFSAADTDPGQLCGPVVERVGRRIAEWIDGRAPDAPENALCCLGGTASRGAGGSHYGGHRGLEFRRMLRRYADAATHRNKSEGGSLARLGEDASLRGRQQYT